MTATPPDPEVNFTEESGTPYIDGLSPPRTAP